jgi:site-specific DNA recombinase
MEIIVKSTFDKIIKNEVIKMKTALYARSATHDPQSIIRQITATSQHCQNSGHSLVAYYIDTAMSGANLERPELQRMVTAAKEQQFETVVIYDMSRISRNIADWLEFRKLMHSNGVRVISVTENLGEFAEPDIFLSESINAVLNNHLQPIENSRLTNQERNGTI